MQCSHPQRSLAQPITVAKGVSQNVALKTEVSPKNRLTGYFCDQVSEGCTFLPMNDISFVSKNIIMLAPRYLPDNTGIKIFTSKCRHDEDDRNSLCKSSSGTAEARKNITTFLRS